MVKIWAFLNGFGMNLVYAVRCTSSPCSCNDSKANKVVEKK